MRMRMARWLLAARNKTAMPPANQFIPLQDFCSRRKNMQRLVSLVVILCVAQRTLGQGFDCSTEAGQIAFLQNGALTDPNCYNPILNLVVADRQLTTAETEVVSETLDSSAKTFGLVE